MNVLILAAGSEEALIHTETGYPLYLTESEGEMLLERIVCQCKKLFPQHILFVARNEQLSRHHVADILVQLDADAKAVPVHGQTKGAACSALLAVDDLDNAAELLIMSATDFITVDLAAIVEGFRSSGADAGTIIFDALHPRYAFARLDSEGHLVEVAEKRPISRNAIAGCHWYRRAADFIGASQRMIMKEAHVNGQFYVSHALNEMVLHNKIVAVHKIAPSQYHPLKSAKQVATLESVLEQLRGYDAI